MFFFFLSTFTEINRFLNLYMDFTMHSISINSIWFQYALKLDLVYAKKQTYQKTKPQKKPNQFGICTDACCHSFYLFVLFSFLVILSKLVVLLWFSNTNYSDQVTNLNEKSELIGLKRNLKKKIVEIEGMMFVTACQTCVYLSARFYSRCS